jgi:hypothetical protein
MKKLVTILLAATIALSMAACTPSDSSSSESMQTSSEQSNISVSDSKELLDTIWNQYSEDDKFPVMGGDTNSENTNTSGPGKFGIEDANALDVSLGFPEKSINKIDDAASLMHMMNANNFTCGAFRVKNNDDVQALASEIKNNIQNRQWVCGFPEKLVVVAIDQYIVSFFGATDIISTFQTNLMEAYPSAQIIYEESLS